jgi:Tfp pilus assembly protein PilP
MRRRVPNPRNHNREAFLVRRIVLLCVAICMAAGLTACSVEPPMQTQEPPAKRRQEVKAPNLEALRPKTDEELYTYDTSGRRDPFKPLIAATKPTAVLSEEKLICPPTQDFELASLKLVAIVWGDMGRKAMLKAPNGRGYAVAEEMLIGRNCGRIRRIESNAIVIEQARQDSEGNVLKEEVVLRLREREG